MLAARPVCQVSTAFGGYPELAGATQFSDAIVLARARAEGKRFEVEGPLNRKAGGEVGREPVSRNPNRDGSAHCRLRSAAACAQGLAAAQHRFGFSSR